MPTVYLVVNAEGLFFTRGGRFVEEYPEAAKLPSKTAHVCAKWYSNRGAMSVVSTDESGEYTTVATYRNGKVVRS